VRILDIFSGIGLFSYAAKHVWNEIEIVSFCENDNFCQKLLKQHYPEVQIHDDIKTLYARKWRGTIDLMVGGPPCQPASVAGKRKGTEDDRWLWPEALRVMAEAQPEWCIFENPLGILTLEKGLVFENLLLEMESQGYAVQPYIIPACAIGASYRKYRVWIVANTTKFRLQNEIQKNGVNKKIHGVRSLSSFNKRPTWEGFNLSRSSEHLRNRGGASDWSHRIKALGNTIQWEVAYMIMKGIQANYYGTWEKTKAKTSNEEGQA